MALWGILVRHIYSNGVNYESPGLLKQAIKMPCKSWILTRFEILEVYFQKRIIHLFAAKGGQLSTTE